MPSSVHQWLVVWLARRLTRDGFQLLGSDAGEYRKYIGGAGVAGWGLVAVRPDLLAIHKESRILGLGEAKTVADLNNDHTRQQLATMLTMGDGSGRPAKVFLTFPRSGLATASRTVPPRPAERPARRPTPAIGSTAPRQIIPTTKNTETRFSC